MAQPIQVIYNIKATNATSLLNAAASGTTNFTPALATNVVGPNQQRLIITMTGNETSNTFVIAGTNQAGFPITETVAGLNNSTATTNVDFLTVTGFRSSANTAGTTSLGPVNVGSTMWFIMNTGPTPSNIEASGIVTSSSTAVTWGVQYTYDDPNNLPPSIGTAQPFNHPTLLSISGTTSADGPINDPVVAVRGVVTNGTGTVRFTFLQAGIGSP